MKASDIKSRFSEFNLKLSSSQTRVTELEAEVKSLKSTSPSPTVKSPRAVTQKVEKVEVIESYSEAIQVSETVVEKETWNVSGLSGAEQEAMEKYRAARKKK